MAASEIWFASNTFAAPLPPTTHSGFSVDFGVVAVANLETGAVAGFGFWGLGISCTSGATDGPMISVIALWAQISSLHTGTCAAIAQRRNQKVDARLNPHTSEVDETTCGAVAIRPNEQLYGRQNRGTSESNVNTRAETVRWTRADEIWVLKPPYGREQTKYGR